jgi:heptosyltransferase-2
LTEWLEGLRMSSQAIATSAASDTRPILFVPYMWIGDFVRCHTVVQVLNTRFPGRPVDVLATPLVATLLDYMPGVRKGVVSDLPRGRLAFQKQWALAKRLRAEGYGTALVMPRTWKSALAPFLAGIPERIGFLGEGRVILLNDVRSGERRLDRMIDRCTALALPNGAPAPAALPLPKLVVPAAEVAAWRERHEFAAESGPIVALCPGAVGAGKSWPVGHYAALARQLAALNIAIWVLGAPNERPLAEEIAAAGGARVRDLTGPGLRNSILALTAANAVVANDSGLMHIAAALGTPTIALFGPSSPRLWAPLNPLAAVIEPPHERPCPQCGKPDCNDVRHRRTDDIAPGRVLDAVRNVLARKRG